MEKIFTSPFHKVPLVVTLLDRSGCTKVSAHFYCFHIIISVRNKLHKVPCFKFYWNFRRSFSLSRGWRSAHSMLTLTFKMDPTKTWRVFLTSFFQLPDEAKPQFPLHRGHVFPAGPAPPCCRNCLGCIMLFPELHHLFIWLSKQEAELWIFKRSCLCGEAANDAPSALIRESWWWNSRTSSQRPGEERFRPEQDIRHDVTASC